MREAPFCVQWMSGMVIYVYSYGGRYLKVKLTGGLCDPTTPRLERERFTTFKLQSTWRSGQDLPSALHMLTDEQVIEEVSCSKIRQHPSDIPEPSEGTGCVRDVGSSDILIITK